MLQDKLKKNVARITGPLLTFNQLCIDYTATNDIRTSIQKTKWLFLS